MRKIEAYKCEYCQKKIYENGLLCYTHEKRCFFNPVNKACASCGNHLRETERLENGHLIDINVCSVGQNIKNKLEYDCKNYSERKEIFETMF